MKEKFYYHYTSIEVLALILESKQIKFSRLDKVNDLTEAETDDHGNMAHLFYVSCWTNQNNESIPFWNMYTNNMKGIRIQLPYPMLKEYSDNFIFETSTYYDNKGKGFFLGYDGFNKIKYLNKKSQTESFLIENELPDNSFSFNPKIGLLKKDVWKFESEWRYKIVLHELVKEFDEESKLTFSKPKINFENIVDSPNELFFELNSETFKKMKIRLGPRTTFAERIIVEALISKFNPNAQIETSELEKIIR